MRAKQFTCKLKTLIKRDVINNSKDHRKEVIKKKQQLEQKLQ